MSDPARSPHAPTSWIEREDLSSVLTKTDASMTMAPTTRIAVDPVNDSLEFGDSETTHPVSSQRAYLTRTVTTSRVLASAATPRYGSSSR